MKLYRNREELVAAYQAGEKIKYLFFWGHQKSDDGSVTKSCFSQWFPAPFEVDGKHYATAEHFMMAEKARLFGDAEMEKLILECSCPKQAKAYGRGVRNFGPEAWNAHGFDAVVRGNIAKFQQNPAMLEFLLNTSNRVIVEASPRDRIWGIGMGQNNEKATNPALWRGKNLLGFALMEVREKLAVAERFQI